MQGIGLNEIMECYQTIPVKCFPDVLSKTSIAMNWLLRVQQIVKVTTIQNLQFRYYKQKSLGQFWQWCTKKVSRSHICKSYSTFTLPRNIIRAWKWWVTWKMPGLSLISHMQAPARPQHPAEQCGSLWCGVAPQNSSQLKGIKQHHVPLWAAVSENEVCRKGLVVLVMSLGVCDWISHSGQIQLDHPFQVQTIFSLTTL